MSGIGRGRGWLNIKREPEPPGGIMTTPDANEAVEDPIQKYLGYIDNITEIPLKYMKSFHEFETIHEAKDLLRNLSKYYNEEEIQQCIILLIQKYLTNWHMNSQAIVNAFNLNRGAVLRSTQTIFENREYLFKKSKTALVKLMILLGRINMIIGMPFTAAGVILCSKFILEPVHNDYVPIFTSCLHQIFYVYFSRQFINEVKCNKYIKYEDFCIVDTLRAAICSTDDAKTRYWLYLALEIWEKGEGVLPDETLDFYAKHLGEQEIKYFRKLPGTHVPLYLDTNQSLHSLEQFTSGVSVLKIDDSPPIQERQDDHNNTKGGIIAIPANTDNKNSGQCRNHNNSRRPSGNIDNHQSISRQEHLPHSGAQNDCYQPPQVNSAPSTGGSGGRAILGSGARKSRNNKQSKQSPRHDQKQEAAMNGRMDEPPSHGAFRDKPPPRDLPRNHNAWNHDDRC